MFERRLITRILICMTLGVIWAALPWETVFGNVISFTKDIEVMPVNDNPARSIQITLTTDKNKVNPGETVTIFFVTTEDCYLTLMDIGTSGKITRLWPNAFSGENNYVQAGRRYSFPSETDGFRYKMSGPSGLERIVAYATSEKGRILSEDEFTAPRSGFRVYQKTLKDLIVESARRTDGLGQRVRWGTAEVTIRVGNAPHNQTITSRNMYLLSVGATTGGLQYCAADARGFTNLLSAKLQIPNDNVRLLLDKQATKTGIASAMGWLAKTSKPSDLVFIYYSGHGTQLPDRPPLDETDQLDEAFVCYHEKPHLTPQDPDLDRILMLDDEFRVLLREIPARRKIVVVDSCHSGTITKTPLENLISKYLPLFKLKQLQIVDAEAAPPHYGDVCKAQETLMAACADSESSFEDRRKKGGLFTYWLLHYLKGAGDLGEAFEKARRSLEEEMVGLTVRQTPQLTDKYGLARDVKF